MKKLFVIVSLIFAGMAVNAQLYMGYRFDIKADQIKNDDGDKRTSSTSIGIYADLGYQLTDKFDIGAEYGGSLGVSENHISGTKDNTAQWLLSPYVRYSLLQAGKFELLGKGSMVLEGSKTEFRMALRAVPVLVYNLNDRIELLTNLNFFNFGISYTKIDKGNATTSFNLGGNSNNVATLGSLTIGFIYKF